WTSQGAGPLRLLARPSLCPARVWRDVPSPWHELVAARGERVDGSHVPYLDCASGADCIPQNRSYSTRSRAFALHVDPSTATWVCGISDEDCLAGNRSQQFNGVLNGGAYFRRGIAAGNHRRAHDSGLETCPHDPKTRNPRRQTRSRIAGGPSSTASTS